MLWKWHHNYGTAWKCIYCKLFLHNKNGNALCLFHSLFIIVNISYDAFSLSRTEVLNSSPPPPPAYFAYLSLLTHLIQIINLLEVCSMHELCSDWHAPYTGSIAPYSLSRGNLLKFTSFRNIQSHARTSVTSYTSVNIHNFNSRLAHFNALWMEYIRLLRTGIMAEYPVMSTSQGTYVRIEQTSEAIRVTYEICRAGGARTGIDNHWSRTRIKHHIYPKKSFEK